MKMKFLFVLLVLLLVGCTPKIYRYEYCKVDLKTEVNQSIIDGFYNGDTINQKVYLVK